MLQNDTSHATLHYLTCKLGALSNNCSQAPSAAETPSAAVKHLQHLQHLHVTLITLACATVTFGCWASSPPSQVRSYVAASLCMPLFEGSIADDSNTLRCPRINLADTSRLPDQGPPSPAWPSKSRKQQLEGLLFSPRALCTSPDDFAQVIFTKAGSVVVSARLFYKMQR